MTIRDAMLNLRTDALRRGMPELAIVCGWSALRNGYDQMEMEIAEIVRGLTRQEP